MIIDTMEETEWEKGGGKLLREGTEFKGPGAEKTRGFQELLGWEQGEGSDP